MSKATDLRLAIFSASISYNDFCYFDVQICGTEKQVEVAKGIEITEISSVVFDLLIIRPK